MINRPSIDDTLRRLKPHLDSLYHASETDQASNDKHHQDATSPLYDALRLSTDRYCATELIARGGMKEVHRVYDLRTARYVAMARPLVGSSSSDFDAFLRESHLTAQLDHPCIIHLFDVGIDDEGRPFFTMELKGGQSLRNLLNSLATGQQLHQYPLLVRLTIFLRVCEAIAHAHSHRILHLDIKPENVQIADHGDVRVCDWGMGVVVPGEGGIQDADVLLDRDLYGSLMDSIKGTPGYMAPEQRNRRMHLTVQTDIFALGRVLWELVTLEPPENCAENRRIDPALAAIIGQATATDPTKRYRDVTSMRNDVARFMQGYGVSAEKTRYLREAYRFYKRNRVPTLVTVCLSALLTISVMYFAEQLRMSNLFGELAMVTAEEAAAKYQAERSESARRQHLQGVVAATQSVKLTRTPMLRIDNLASIAGFALKDLNLAIATDLPPTSPAWYRKAWIHFLMQDFQAAVRLDQDGVDITSDLARLAHAYAPQVGPQGYLDSDDFISLMHDLLKLDRADTPTIERMLIFDTVNPRSMEDRVRIVREWVALNNRKWVSGELLYDSESGTVRLHGAGLRSLVRTIRPGEESACLLYTLRPKYLDLQGTEISDLSELNSLELLQLDIRQTPVTDLTPLQAIRSLRRVTISPGQISAEIISQFPKWIEVVQMDGPDSTPADHSFAVKNGSRKSLAK